MFRHFLKSRASLSMVVAWEDKQFYSRSPSSLPPAFSEYEVFQYGISLQIVKVTALAVSPPCFLTTPACWYFGGSWRGSLDAVPVLLSNSQNTDVVSIYF